MICGQSQFYLWILSCIISLSVCLAYLLIVIDSVTFFLSGFTEIFSGCEMEHVISNLEPGTTYSVRVSCESDGGFSKVCTACSSPSMITSKLGNPQSVVTPKHDNLQAW